MATPTVGQIGLGNMGGNVARCLLDAGFDVVGFDVEEAALAEFEEHGGRAADSNAEVAAAADVLLSALNYPEVVEAAYLGPDGVVAGAGDDLICVEQSTVPPDTTRQLAGDLEGHGVELLGAAFQGTPDDCRNGTLVVPVGGDRTTFEDERVQAVFEATTREVNYMGEVGAGKATKLVSQTMTMGNTVVALEALSLGVAQGLDPARLHEAMKWGGGTSLALRLFVPTAFQRDFRPTFTIEYTLKDLRYALRAAEDADFPLSVGSTVLQLFTAAAAKGYTDESPTAVVKVFEEYLEGELASDAVEVPESDPVFGD